MRRKRITRRTPKQLIKLAYDLEYLASNLRAEGYESEANAIRSVSSDCGNVGRSLENKIK